MSNENNKLQQAIDAVSKYGSIASAAKALKMPRKTLSAQYNKAIDRGFVAGTPQLSPEQEIGLDSKLKTVVKDKRELQKKYDELLKILDVERNQSSVVSEFHSRIDTLDQEKIEPIKDTAKSESTAIILCSDLHYEEVVDPNKIDQLNEYNTTIAKRRFNKLFQNALKLIDINRNGANITQCVLWLGGDLINGYIHPEFVENNEMSPIEACLEVYKLCISSIDFLLENGNFDKLHIVTNIGNHGRTTDKMRVSTSAENSYEYMIYNFLANHYVKNKKVNFKITKGYFNWMNIYGYDIRFHHGDNVRFAGGVGGITIPLNKAIAQWNQAKAAYLDIMGHWHQRMSTKNAIINGSVVGYNEYALSIKAAFERPQQSFLLMNSKYGKTIEAPIFLE
jgi:hypothetical protein